MAMLWGRRGGIKLSFPPCLPLQLGVATNPHESEWLGAHGQGRPAGWEGKSQKEFKDCRCTLRQEKLSLVTHPSGVFRR